MFRVAALALPFLSSLTHAKAPPAAAPAGVAQVPAFSLPFSDLASPQAREAFIIRSRTGPAAPAERDIAEIRDSLNRNVVRPMLDAQRKAYPSITIEEKSIGGVPCAIVTPEHPAPNRVLIELHGGAFMVGDLSLGEAEAIPVAAQSRMKVVAVKYRQGPEFEFPAASQDVAAVYRGLLRHYRAVDIGIFGTSAGGLLTAEAAAWLRKENLPRPGALGIFASGAEGWNDGDSKYVASAILGEPQTTENGGSEHGVVGNTPYLRNADLKDPLVGPLWDKVTLAAFPPTLLITGTRAMDLSAVVFTHTQMVKAGVDSELHVWEGMEHAFNAGSLPESAEAVAVEAAFFRKHLGHRSGVATR